MVSYPIRTGLSTGKVILLCALSAIITAGVVELIHASLHRSGPAAVSLAPVCPESMQMTRIRKNRLTQPLLLADIRNESTLYLGLKQELTSYIRDEIQAGKAKDVSVYIRDMRTGAWMSINPQLTYDPASIMKMVILLAYLKKEEAEPGLLNKQLVYKRSEIPVREQRIRSGGVEDGRSYTIKQLMEYMIIDSDNNANFLLNKNVDPEYVTAVFEDLELPVPDVKATSVSFNCIDVSKFIRVLFNASYLSNKNSEFAMDMLSRIAFQDGFISGLPKDIDVAHKFGEKFYPGTEIQELHELGIVYYASRPFLLTVMTRGKSIENQELIIRDVARICYNWTASNIPDSQ